MLSFSNKKKREENRNRKWEQNNKFKMDLTQKKRTENIKRVSKETNKQKI